RPDAFGIHQPVRAGARVGGGRRIVGGSEDLRTKDCFLEGSPQRGVFAGRYIAAWVGGVPMPYRIPRLRYVEIDRDVDLCLPLIRPIGLTPLSGDIRDEAHRRAAPAPRCPGSVAAHSAGQARP